MHVSKQGSILTVSGVSHRFGASEVLRGIDLELIPGEFIGVIGPNGAGKSTLMRVMAGILPPTSGSVHFRERLLRSWNPKSRARHIAFVSQNPRMDFDFTVKEVVSMGRYAHIKRFITPSASDLTLVTQSMDRADISHLKERSINELSGGERQRVFLGRAMAQQPQLLFLDEPTAHLDMRYQLDILELTEKLNVRDRLTVVMAIHDLNLALRYCGRLIVLSEGCVVADGRSADVLNEKMLWEVFQVAARVERDPTTRMPSRVDYVLNRNELPTGDVSIDRRRI